MLDATAAACGQSWAGEKGAPGMERSPGGREREEAARCRLLDAVLSSLYDLGEEPIVKNGKKKIQKKAVENKITLEPIRTVMKDRAAHPDSAARRKRKSRRASTFFEALKNEVNHDSENSEGSASESRHPNSLLPKPMQQGKTTEVEVVIFHSRNRKKKPKLEVTQDNVSKAKMAIPEKNVNVEEFNLEKARLEVHRFGITAYEKKEQRILEQERAIMLGAKPPKKEYLNYKIFQEKIKEKKTMKKEDSSMEYKSDSIKKKKKKGQEQRKAKKKKSGASILPTGQVGKFTNGTLILRGSDLRKIKSSKVVN
ncbi:40S small subunit processome assembly factor 1 [Carettochelys insculpta]|uniref:40S small subunit processome assembly factor 1 n=1 Tax=Carettochelys insculpta TaxID=44489 RepID=UPI003EB9D0E1